MTDLKIARGFTLPLDLVTEATAIVATRGAGKSSASAVLVEEGFAAGVQCVVFDRTGVYWGLRSNAAGDGPGLPIYVLGGPHGDAPLEGHAGALIADLAVDSGHSLVLDLSDLSKGQATRFAADFLERLYDRKANARTTLLLVMDEAHFYAPQTPRGGFKGDSAKLMGAMEDVVGLGRSRGLGVVLTTQRTQALNKAVLDLIETLLVMRMLSPRARLAVKDWIQEKHEDDERGVIASLDSLPTGTAWVWSPLRGILEKVAVRRIRTFDSYATPKPGQARLEPTARKELDLDALGEQIRATAERARENDPAELRKRIRELEATGGGAVAQLVGEIDDALREVGEPIRPGEAVVDAVRRALEARPAPERVEVPVLDEATLLSLSTILRRGEGLAEQAAEYADGLRASLSEVARQVSEAQVKEAPSAGRAEERNGRDTSRPAPTGNGSVGTSAAAPPARPADGVTGPQQKILDALAWWERVGVDQPSPSQVAFVVGYHARSKGFTNNLSALSSARLIQRGPGAVGLTPDGSRIARPPSVTPTNEGLQQMIYTQVGGKRAEILRYLIDVGHRLELPIEEVAEHMGYHPRSKGFTNNLSTLSGLGLVDRSPGRVKASDLCFLT